MRISSWFFAAALLASAAFPTAVVAQAPSSLPCDGVYNIVRISEVKSGKMGTFLQAVAAQKAWYKQAGTKDEIAVMRIADPATKAYSETEAITTHITPTGAQTAKQDAGYDAFVALFKASSTIKTQYYTCQK